MFPPGAIGAPNPPAERPVQLGRGSIGPGRKSRFSCVVDRVDRDLFVHDDSDSDAEEETGGELQAELEGITQARDSPLPDQVDVLECALGIAFRNHRVHVEEVLGRYMEAMQYAEAKHAQEVAKLKAENEQLRVRCGLRGPPDLTQAVLFNDALEKQAKADDAAEKARKRNGESDQSQRKKAGARLAGGGLDDKDTESAAILKKKKDAEQQDKPGGSWQQFVAWVPNTAALAAPQPWEPLPESILQPSTLPPGMPVRPADGKGKVQDGTLTASVERAQDLELLDLWQHGDDEEDMMLDDGKLWVATKKGHDGHDGRRRSADGASTASKNTKLQSMQTQVFETEKRGDWWILHPHSMARLSWDVTGLMLVVYDMITIPMSLFQLPPSAFLEFMEWTTRLFWTFDMGMSCVTGVVLPDGSVETSCRFVLKRYVRTWLVFDVIIMGSAWLEVIIEASGSGTVGSLARLSRAFRAVRVVRLLRLVKMKDVMEKITERVQSDAIAFVVLVLKLTLFIIAISHVIGCIWWGIGNQHNDLSWTSKYGYDETAFDAQYMVSLNWALRQFSGGMDEITPVTTGERAFAVVIWMFAFMVAAFVVSVLASKLTQTYIIGGAREKQMSMLRKYLIQNTISSNLAMRVQRSAQHTLSADLTPDVVELLQVVSEPLRAEMHLEMYSAVLKYHPFFNDLINEAPQVIKRICHFAINTAVMSAGDIVFSSGERPAEPKMYFVVKGQLDYLDGKFGRNGSDPVTERQWVAEMVLWLRWSHRGTLTAFGDAKLAVLCSREFQDIVIRFKDLAHLGFKRYARLYVDALSQATRINDLTMGPFPGTRGRKGSITLPTGAAIHAFGTVLPTGR